VINTGPYIYHERHRAPDLEDAAQPHRSQHDAP
jgi:hypothetical protein